MKRWNRWQDYVAVIAGLYAALATLWTTQQASSMVMMIGVGVLLIIAGVWNLMGTVQPVAEWILLLLGALLFISPWIAGYTVHTGATWTSWIAGAIALIVGVLALQPSMHKGTSHHHGGATAH
ncbi:SPW repeat protein [Arthrobacter sp. H35-D1]|uniref:SPW repeat protein n=1 Tax=Arthrobacter sp. H35-D1 TaxID=3046202 RepID=UPI0024BB0E7D|nr:SPW repeat protein [Arthrobacter sp. H35-D1]MDJ0313650.1 SPW repeat protein [Arthrobacter sp. H35-D1]